jgi:hypothetical protein
MCICVVRLVHRNTILKLNSAPVQLMPYA